MRAASKMRATRGLRRQRDASCADGGPRPVLLPHRGSRGSLGADATPSLADARLHEVARCNREGLLPQERRRRGRVAGSRGREHRAGHVSRRGAGGRDSRRRGPGAARPPHATHRERHLFLDDPRGRAASEEPRSRFREKWVSSLAPGTEGTVVFPPESDSARVERVRGGLGSDIRACACSWIRSTEVRARAPAHLREIRPTAKSPDDRNSPASRPQRRRHVQPPSDSSFLQKRTSRMSHLTTAATHTAT